ncbi:MAG: hypothetical protein LBS36_01885 [Oscillospiraceae bacterium]|jgi:hypothetical protein|nr:hypothetical protein [Oscillospiraceae bacterium]
MSEAMETTAINSNALTDEDLLKMKATELASLNRSVDDLKERIDQLKAYFERLATDQLLDTKLKSVDFWGYGSRVVVTETETVKPVSVEILKRVFGAIGKEWIKEETTYKLTDPCKRLLGAVFQGNYTEGSIDELIESITADEKLQATLRKKLKGRYEKDKAALLALTGCTEQEASDNAYLAAEVINWGWLLQILQAAEWKGSPQEAIDLIRAAVIVDTGTKVTVESEI